MSKNKRLRAGKKGTRGEVWAALLLRLKGYRILARDYRVASGEIDIIARRGSTVAFIEVKARNELSTALEAISAQQRARIVRASEHYLVRHPHLQSCDLRFDVVAIRPRRFPKHIPDAWRE